MADSQFAGPVDYLVFSFPQNASVGAGLRLVLDRVDAGIIEVLDIEVITQDAAGDGVPRTLADLQPDTDLDLSVFDGVVSGILDAGDIAAITAALAPGEFALAIVYEDRSLAAAADAWTRVGGAELFSGGVAIEDLEHALDEGEPR